MYITIEPTQTGVTVWLRREEGARPTGLRVPVEGERGPVQRIADTIADAVRLGRDHPFDTGEEVRKITLPASPGHAAAFTADGRIVLVRFPFAPADEYALRAALTQAIAWGRAQARRELRREKEGGAL
jgi:hypothetical protein